MGNLWHSAVHYVVLERQAELKHEKFTVISNPQACCELSCKAWRKIRLFRVKRYFQETITTARTSLWALLSAVCMCVEGGIP